MILFAIYSYQSQIILPEIVVRASKKKSCIEKTVEGLKDILSITPGITISQTSAQAHMRIRGLMPHHNLVTYDDMKSSDPGSVNSIPTYLNDLMDDSQEVKILKGPEAILFGQQSSSGLVKIKTRKAQKKKSLVLQTEIGSPFLSHSLLQTQGIRENLHYNISFSHLNSSGIVIRPKRLQTKSELQKTSPYQNSNIIARFDCDLNDKLGLTFFSRDFWHKSNYNIIKPPSLYFCSGENFLNQLCLVHKAITNTKQKFSVSHGYFKNLHKQNNVIEPEQSQSGQRIEYKLSNKWEPSSNNLIRCLLYYEMQSLWQCNPNLLEAQSTQIGLVGSYRYSFYKNTYVQTGLRLDKISNQTPIITYQLCCSYEDKNRDIIIKSGFGTGFVSPSLLQLYTNAPTYKGNPDLRPEKSISYDVGVSKYVGNICFGSTYFLNFVTNFIKFSNNTYQNIDRVRSYGFENFFDIKLSSYIKLHLDYTFVNARNVNENTPLTHQPSHKCGLLLKYENNFYIHVGFTYNGSQSDYRYYEESKSYYKQAVQLPGYSLIDLKFIYPIGKKLKIFGRIENALNEKYENPYDYQGKGFSLYLGMRWDIV